MVLLADPEKQREVKGLRAITLLLLFGLLCTSAVAQLRVDRVFSDHMVMPADAPTPVWGWGVPGIEVTVDFGGNVARADTGPDSSWRVMLPTMPANGLPSTMKISMGSDSIVLRDVLVGDVWLCIGQSNMEWTMRSEMHWEKEKRTADQPQIRFMNPSPAGRNLYGTPYRDTLLHRLTTDRFYAWEGWWRCDSASVASMSAVAYHFAKRVRMDVDRPIGLVNLSIGGAPLETFIGIDAMRNHPRFRSKTVGDWLANDSLPVWVRERGRQNVGGGRALHSDENGANHAFKPGFAYASGVVPLASFPVKGVLVYQGESNAEEMSRVLEYGELFRLMVDDYRRLWRNPALPFLWVQLSSIERPYWPAFRDMQRRMLDEIGHSGMAVSSDVGMRTDVHPRDKRTVGGRLALWALKLTYGRDIVPSGPLPVKARYRRGKVVVAWRYAEDGLVAADGKPLRGFSLDGVSEARARIKGSRVFVESPKRPDSLFYAGKPFTDANLVNGSRLPASTFKIPVR